jgi:hypothetical protein
MNETKEKKQNKAKQKRDSERENIQYHFVHLLHFSTHVFWNTLMNVRYRPVGTKEEQTEQTQMPINPHTI